MDLCAAGVNRTPDQALFLFGLYHHPGMPGAGRFRSDVNRRVLLKRIVSTPSPIYKGLGSGFYPIKIGSFPEFTQLHFCITTERPEDSGVCSTTELPRHGILLNERVDDAGLEPATPSV